MANTSYGTCMYMEFRMDSVTAQSVIIPDHARYGVAEEGRSPAILMHRRQDIQKSQTRQPWNFTALISPTLNSRSMSNTTDLFLADASLTDALQDARSVYNQAANHFESLQSARFVLYQRPLFVEIGPAEIRDIDQGLRPEGFLRRIDRVRADAGFTKELWDARYMG